ncbi:hypothetical protein [Actinoallomurus liliacearum]|uniref:hypothetical protein n=1 Tax=Actinoallomurus liliacearum TaxID=1080073 RepID=UPI0031EBC020
MIDFFIVNVVLPTIDTTLHAGATTLELVVAGYGIAYAVLLVLGGRLGDMFGAGGCSWPAWPRSRWPRWRAGWRRPRPSSCSLA